MSWVYPCVVFGFRCFLPDRRHADQLLGITRGCPVLRHDPDEADAVARRRLKRPLPSIRDPISVGRYPPATVRRERVSGLHSHHPRGAIGHGQVRNSVRGGWDHADSGTRRILMGIVLAPVRYAQTPPRPGMSRRRHGGGIRSVARIHWLRSGPPRRYRGGRGSPRSRRSRRQ